MTSPGARPGGAPPAPVRVRRALATDAADLSRLANELDLHEGLNGRVFTPETVARDGFGPDPLFHALIAEAGDGPVGYLLWYWGYCTDRALPKFWLSDLFVRRSARGAGAGRALVAEARRLAEARGCGSLELPMRSANQAARRFYDGLGFRAKGSEILELELRPRP